MVASSGVTRPATVSGAVGSIPVRFRTSAISPMDIQGTEYEDADESVPVAARAARQEGAQFVFSVLSARACKAPAGTSA